jgi:hypothetical protein
LRLLQQGNETETSFKKLITEYLDVLIGREVNLLQKASKNLPDVKSKSLGKRDSCRLGLLQQGKGALFLKFDNVDGGLITVLNLPPRPAYLETHRLVGIVIKMSHQLGSFAMLLSCLAKEFVVRSKDVGVLFLPRTMPSQKLLFGKELALVGRSCSCSKGIKVWFTSSMYSINATKGLIRG